jgi:tripartite-type tricarboxylate transporter receptor subunit TctC
MKMRLSTLTRGFALALGVCAAGATPTAAQSQVTRPLRVMVTFPPGGATDISARLIAPRLGENLGQQLIVDNRPGASGMIATALLARAAPDGHTILVVDTAHGANPALNDKMAYDTLKDIAGVSLLMRVPMLFLVNPAFPAQSLKELIALAKASPGKYNYGSAGLGSTMYLLAESFKASAGIDLVHVAYKGGGPALAEVMGGQIPITFLSTAASMQQVKAGRVRALAISGRERSPVVPEVPTAAESGVPGFEFYLWQAVLVPAGMPPAVMARLSGAVTATLTHAEMKERFVALGAETTPTTPQQADAYIRKEVERWIKTLKPLAASK